MTQGTGTLYIVATPIGHLDDISKRALDVLNSVDCIVAEDTRNTLKLLNKYTIQKPMTAYYKDNEKQMVAKLLERLKNGQDLALVSDAGMPCISDPGAILVEATHMAGIPVIPIPGPSAMTTAYAMSGLSYGQFVFVGFLPRKSGERLQSLKALEKERRDMIFFESPRRILALLGDMQACLGKERRVFVVKELTKTHEQSKLGALEEVNAWLNELDEPEKGEYVVILEGHRIKETFDESLAQRVLMPLLEELPLSQSVKLATKITGQAKGVLYDLALRLKDGS